MSNGTILKLTNPLLTTWSSESHLEAVILQDPAARIWMFNNYVNVVGNYVGFKNVYLMRFFPQHDPCDPALLLNAWTACPFVELHYVSSLFVKEHFSSVIGYLKHCIDQGYFVYLDLDQRMIKIRDRIHKTFIYGYNDSTREVYASDHLDYGKYERFSIKFEDFEKMAKSAYFDEQKILESARRFQQDLLTSSYEYRNFVIIKKQSYSFEFNMDWFKLQLSDYLNGVYRFDSFAPTINKNKQVKYFGVNTYDLMLKYIDDLITDKTNHRDWRIFTLLYDHKFLMKERIEYFIMHNYISANQIDVYAFGEIVDDARTIVNIFIKYGITKQKKSLEKIRNLLCAISAKERNILQNLYDLI